MTSVKNKVTLENKISLKITKYAIQLRIYEGENTTSFGNPYWYQDLAWIDSKKKKTEPKANGDFEGFFRYDGVAW